jgi:hypothetical protein
MGAGFALYYLTVGRLVLKLNQKLALLIKKIIRRAFSLIIYPARALIRAIISLYHLTIGKIIGKIIRKIKIAREQKKAAEHTEPEADASACGKEDFVYVDGKIGYQRNGRISFGRK